MEEERVSIDYNKRKEKKKERERERRERESKLSDAPKQTLKHTSTHTDGTFMYMNYSNTYLATLSFDVIGHKRATFVNTDAARNIERAIGKNTVRIYPFFN